jgi:2-(3-amino-3-carboxypropyl)histidine synthase
MRDARREAILQARRARHWGVVLGTLGRQGNPRIMQLLQQKLAGGCKQVRACVA